MNITNFYQLYTFDKTEFIQHSIYTTFRRHELENASPIFCTSTKAVLDVLIHLPKKKYYIQSVHITGIELGKDMFLNEVRRKVHEKLRILPKTN